MNKAEFQSAFDIAKSDADLSQDPVYIFNFFSCRDFQPVVCTLRQVARLMRLQAHELGGQWDMAALSEIREAGRKKFEIVG